MEENPSFQVAKTFYLVQLSEKNQKILCLGRKYLNIYPSRNGQQKLGSFEDYDKTSILLRF